MRTTLETMRDVLGFDQSEWADEGAPAIDVACSQCAALVICGTPCHETGCPNVPVKRECFQCGSTEDWSEDGRGNILCSCQACPDCYLVDAYGSHEPGCPQTKEQDEDDEE